jgi:hypothetical protein
VREIMRFTRVYENFRENVKLETHKSTISRSWSTS